jgi:hypothetical protein
MNEMTVEEMLRTLSNDDLEHYRRALELDRASSKTELSRARAIFCTCRIDLIDVILRERELEKEQSA